MTQYFDFVALGWVEKYLREEMDMAQKCLHRYEREPDDMQHLREVLRNVHSATGVLRLCALDPAALLTEEIERVVSQLIDGGITGEARRLAMTELVAAIEALPAYLANVRAKREVSAGAIANVINDLRHFGNRPPLPDSLFFNPSLKPGAGISKNKQIADEAKLKNIAARALRVCHKYSKPALRRDHEALKRLFAVGKHATPMLAGSAMEAYFRCYMGLIEALAQPGSSSDEVIVDIFKNTFVFLKSLARNGVQAVDEANPMPYIKKMLYYIAKSPNPTTLQKRLREIFDVHDVDDVRIESAGRLIQEDDLLEALNHTMSDLLEVMDFINSNNQEISSKNKDLVDTIVPRLRQIGLQLKAIGLNTHADSIAEQHEVLLVLSEGDEPAPQHELLGFGGALVAVKESLEHKLKHGLSAHGDSMGHDLDAAIMTQTVRCLGDMKNSINREFARQDLLRLLEEVESTDTVTLAHVRPLYRAATAVGESALQETISTWESGNLPAQEEMVKVAQDLLAKLPGHAYAEKAAADVEQVLSVLSLMEDKQRESNILANCTGYIHESIRLGGLFNDAGMACFAEAIAALEQYMERRTEDPLGNSDEHLDRAEARASMLATFVEQRAGTGSASDNLMELDIPETPVDIVGDLDLSDAEDTPVPETGAAVSQLQGPSNVVELVLSEVKEEAPAEAETPAEPVAGGIHWREGLEQWSSAAVDRGPDAPPEDPSVEIDEELVDIFVEEARKYIRKLEDAVPRFAAALDNEQVILDIRAIFHTMKGSARTIELNEFGEFMFDMEKVYNALRDGYIKGTPEIAELTEVVAGRLPQFIDTIMERVPLYTVDFQVPHSIAEAISEKRFDAETMTVAACAVAEAAESQAEQPSAEDSADAEVEAEQEETAPQAETEHAAEAEDEPEEASADDAGEQVEAAEVEAQASESTDFSTIWSRAGIEEIIASVNEQLEQYRQGMEADLQAANSLILMQALVPALVEMREGDFVQLDAETVGHFIELPVLEQLASNSVFGLVDNGKGECFKFPLSAEVSEGLQRYLDRLTEEADAAEGVAHMHADVEAYIRSALTLPELRLTTHNVVGLPLGSSQALELVSDIKEIDDKQDEVTLQEVVVTGADLDPEEPDEEDPSSPKLELEAEPEALLEDTVVGEETAFDTLAEALLDTTAEAGEELEADFTLDADLEISLETTVETPAEASAQPTVEAVAEPEVLPELEVTEVEIATETEAATEAEAAPETVAAIEAEAAPETEVPTETEVVAEAAADKPDDAPVETQVEDIDLELLDLFIETLDEYLESIDGALAELGRHETSAVQGLKNTLHTIKGGANSIGLRQFGALVHDFESRIVDLEHESDITSPAALQQIYPLVDGLQEASNYVKRRQTDWDSSAASEPEAVEPVVAEVTEKLKEVPQEQPKELLLPVKSDEEREEAPELQRVESLRVSTGKIDRLLDTGLEISMSNVRGRRALDAAQQDRTEVQGLARRIQDLVDKLSLQLDTEIQAKTEAVSEGEQFDPLEMDRITEKQGLAAILREAAYDLHEEARELGEHIDTAMRETLSSGRLVEGSQSEMRLLRLVSFAKLGPGFRRLIAQVCRRLNKQVDFEITCDEGGLDVSVFEQVKTALEHMLRNAVDHGIDVPEERVRRGKAASGKVSLTIKRQASEFVVRLVDDGNGLDPDALRSKALDRGLITEHDDLSDQEALRLIFRSGLSTASKVTDISGRGVGMDVVAQSIAQVGGTIEVQSKPGFYTQFDMRIPASIMVNGALLASIGEEQVAIPLTSLDGSDFRQREEVYEIAEAEEGTIKFRHYEYELRYLGAVRGTQSAPKIEDMPEFIPVFFAQRDRRRVAFFADSVTNAAELVIRSLGAQYTSVPGIAGGSLKSDGQPVLALDLNELIRQVDYADEQTELAGIDKSVTTMVLCVDDSVMMRRTYEKRLESLGYKVVTAVDGEDALDFLSEAKRLPDFIFTDLEMPKMNGFDFIANLRRVPALDKIPAVVVSSRDGDKHRTEAERVGATDFMAKGANSAEGMQAMIERYMTNTALAS